MPESHPIFEQAQAIFAFLGGGAMATAVLAFFANFFVNKVIERQKGALNKELERLKAELSKEIESHKLSLKKQELIFNKELDAAGDFMKLHRQIRPSYSHPDMDWDDACADVANRFEKIESDLNSFLVKHGAIITTSARKLLDVCIGLASGTKFWDFEYPDEPQGSAYAKNTASKLLDELSKIEEQLIAAVRS
jgi:hypothetical protein